ncbi:hypothetical protein [Planktotalea sp.]|uniref:hypothetical protein n=1 Tax=Planktotalea sp. TaxID=2029877 RepID=UPI003D6AF80F
MSNPTKAEAYADLKKRDRIIAALLTLGRYLPFGALFGTRFERDFSSATVKPQTGEFLVPEEFHDSDETALFEELSHLFASDVTKHPKGIGKRNPDHQDAHWGHSTGLVNGTLTIDQIDNLPEQFRVGLFESNGNYKIIGRPNYLYEHPTIAVARLALKLEFPVDVPNVYAPSGTARELDLLLSEGVRQSETGDQDGQGFFFRDARQLLLANSLKTGALKAFWMLINSANGKVYTRWNEIFKASTDTLYSKEQRQKGWAGKNYFSAGPYALGGGLMKFAIKPLQTNPIADIDPKLENPATHLKEAFASWRQAGVPAEFEFQVQIARWDSIKAPADEELPPKAIMAAEFTDLVWDEEVSPFVSVGRLTLQPADWDAFGEWYGSGEDRWNPEAGFAPHALRFNAWNTLDVMRPVGQLFRARKFVHHHHRDVRLEHSFQETPNGPSKCPFG